VANLLGWTGGSGFRSDKEFKCCPVPSVAADGDADPPVEAMDAMRGWKVDYDPTPLDESLLEPVRQRGPIWVQPSG
jgi:hypothetical protein